MNGRPWAEGTTPTPEQLARYLKRAPRPERERLARVMLADAAHASRCVQLEHQADAVRVRFLEADLAHLRAALRRRDQEAAGLT